MAVYMTEEEQLESIKKWWKRYGNLVSIILSLILLSIAGYRYWSWHQTKLTQQASIAYEHMMVALSKQNNKTVRSFANELIHEHTGSVYADVAHMTLAKIYVSKNKLAQARNELNDVATKSKVLPLKQIAKIRLARIFATEKSYANALQELNQIDDPAYLPIINELKGDIYGAMGQYQEAMNSYKSALDEVKTKGMNNSFLEMKANEVTSKSHSMITSNEKIKPA